MDRRDVGVGAIQKERGLRVIWPSEEAKCELPLIASKVHFRTVRDGNLKGVTTTHGFTNFTHVVLLSADFFLREIRLSFAIPS